MQAEGQDTYGIAEVAPVHTHLASPPRDAGGPPRRTLNAAAFVLPPEGIDLDALERHMVVQALERAKGNKTRAGVLLGLTRDQVRYRMQKYGL
jgi:transcriptional regulator with GAF, ATPase, and Fis domain